MRIFPVIALAVCFMLSACGADKPIDSQQAGGQESKASVPKKAARKPARKTGEIEKGVKTLGQEMSIHTSYDRIRKAQGGVQQQQVFVEILGASPEEIAEQAEVVFQKQGFEVRKGLSDENGIRFQYLKSGMEPINARIRAKDAGPKLKDPKATASLYLRQNLH